MFLIYTNIIENAIKLLMYLNVTVTSQKCLLTEVALGNNGKYLEQGKNNIFAEGNNLNYWADQFFDRPFFCSSVSLLSSG